MDFRSLGKTISENLVYDLIKYGAVAIGGVVIAASTYVIHKWLPTHDVIAASMVLVLSVCVFVWLTKQVAHGNIRYQVRAHENDTKGEMAVAAISAPLPARVFEAGCPTHSRTLGGWPTSRGISILIRRWGSQRRCSGYPASLASKNNGCPTSREVREVGLDAVGIGRVWSLRFSNEFQVTQDIARDSEKAPLLATNARNGAPTFVTMLVKWATPHEV